jgi:hypothetical protein
VFRFVGSLLLLCEVREEEEEEEEEEIDRCKYMPTRDACKHANYPVGKESEIGAPSLRLSVYRCLGAFCFCFFVRMVPSPHALSLSLLLSPILLLLGNTEEDGGFFFLHASVIPTLPT